jgi:hypothetical protein
LKFDDFDELEREFFVNIERERKKTSENPNDGKKDSVADQDTFLTNRKRISDNLLPPPINIHPSVSVRIVADILIQYNRVNALALEA